MPNHIRIDAMSDVAKAENLIKKGFVSEIWDSKVLAEFVSENKIYPEEAVGRQNWAARKFDVSSLKGIEKEARWI